MSTNSVRESNPLLSGVVPYDAKNLPVDVFLSANENPSDVPESVKTEILDRLRTLPFNRYPDPLARTLRALIAEANGLEPENVLLGNGGDEQLFNIFLTWGGAGRTFLNVPPTFSVYEANAHLTGTTVVNVPRLPDFSLDEQAILDRVAQGDVDLVIIASPNNPTGELAPEDFLVRLLDSTDALVMVDEAYFEFSRRTMRPYMAQFPNLLLLRTFSKAFSLAGVRLGYLLGNRQVIREFLKVRQPYSVDAVSQVIGETVYRNRAQFEPAMKDIISRRKRLYGELQSMPGVTVYPSDSNYLLFRVDDAHDVWQHLLEDYSVLVRDFSSAPRLEGCLRVSIGSEEEVRRFTQALSAILENRPRGRDPRPTSGVASEEER